MIRVSQLRDEELSEYDAYLLKDPETLVYASSKYRSLLREYTGAQPRYFVARDSHGEIAGVLPAFLASGADGPPVLNSLPFYGSNGGIIAHGRLAAQARRLLLDAFHECAEREQCVAATIITSPFEADPEFYAGARATFRDERIGQLTPLPQGGHDVEARLLSTFADPRPRNIRRAQKAGVECAVEHHADALAFLHGVHDANMRAIGGRAKPRRFFDAVPRHFTSDDYAVYVARIGDTPVAALLLLYFNRTVEYFTPATVESARSDQPLSLLIFRAMVDASMRGYRWWNWGGTWLSQGGVYDFKKRWGTMDRKYHYFTRVMDDRILTRAPADLLREYPNFYVVPFGQLRAPTPGPAHVETS